MVLFVTPPYLNRTFNQISSPTALPRRYARREAQKWPGSMLKRNHFLFIAGQELSPYENLFSQEDRGRVGTIFYQTVSILMRILLYSILMRTKGILFF